MADATTVVEDKIKFREGKKWKSRWCVLKKLSPVADQLQVSLYKDVSELAHHGAKPKSVFTLDSFFGLDAGFSYDREAHVLAIVCLKHVYLFAFELREKMIQFEIKIRQSLGEERQFPVKVVKAPSNSRLPKEQLLLMIHNTRFCLTSQAPPKVLLAWNTDDLRRFGARDGKFCFEGGTRCGKGSGVFALESEQADDIADIVNLASTGKMANCHRKFKNRSSQIDIGSHLIADIAPYQSPSYHHPHPQSFGASRAPTQGALPSTLNCCHDNQTGSAESEDWSWYKRHSVSVMDYHRMAAMQEKGYADGRDQLMMGIYDVPPCHTRKLDHDHQESGYDLPRSEYRMAESSQPSSMDSSFATSASSSFGTIDAEYGNYKKIETKKKDKSHTGEKKKQKNAFVFPNSVVDDAVPQNSGPGSNAAQHLHNETLQRLRKQESDLQREMVLLDEILQDCAARSQQLTEEASKQEEGKKKSMQNLNSSSNDVEIYSNSQTHAGHTPQWGNENSYRASQAAASKAALTTLDQDFEIISGNVSSVKPAQIPEQVTPVKKTHRAASLRLNTSMPEGMPLSPLFHAKLNNIAQGSRLNAPLPYVNLSKYDDESYSHVHLPGSADCVPVSRGFNLLGPQSPAGTNGQNPLGWRGHSSSLSSLHNAAGASSPTSLSHKKLNKSPASWRDQIMNIREKQFQLNANDNRVNTSFTAHREGSAGVQGEILVVNMEKRPVQADRSLHLSFPSLRQEEVQTVRMPSTQGSDMLNILTTDASKSRKESMKPAHEEIYENLPAMREDTPPPELPPKGPALLKKLKVSATKIDSSPPNRNAASPSSPISQRNLAKHNKENKSYGYDNHPGQYNCGNNAMRNTEQMPRRRSDQGSEKPEDNYLVMGSPKIRHRLSTVTEPSANSSQLSLDTMVPSPFGKGLPRGDYMDMGVSGGDRLNMSSDQRHEDDLYLETDRDKGEKDLYISEADLKRDVSFTLSPSSYHCEAKGESTYMEMANVMKRKSLVLQNAEPPQTQAYVNKSQVGEKHQTASPEQQAKVTPPRRPPSLKVRHNSDSGLPAMMAESCFTESDKSPVKTKKKSSTKVYTKIKSSNKKSPGADAPLPFPKLLEFTNKMSDSRSTYVNTYVDADQNLMPHETFEPKPVLLPLPSEPQKEGFLARFKRRSSKDKSASPAQEKVTNSKNRNSVLERSLSEHESPLNPKEEKTSKLKIGRRRSSSFPNRLSFQESLGDASNIPVIKPTGSSSSSFSSGSSKPMAVARKNDNSESSSSMHDFSDDSDMSPLLKRGEKMDAAITLLHVRREEFPGVNPYQSVDDNLRYHDLDSSKTDDEKLIEMLQKTGPESKETNLSKGGIDFYETKGKLVNMKLQPLLGTTDQTSVDIPEREDTLKSVDMNQEKQNQEEEELTAAQSLSVEEDSPSARAPVLPPKTRHYQGLLSPVMEVAPPIPPHPQSCKEPVYVEMGEIKRPGALLMERNFEEKMQIEKEGKQFTIKKSQEGSRPPFRIAPVVDDEEGNCWVPQDSVEFKAGRDSISSSPQEDVSDLHHRPLTVSIAIPPPKKDEMDDGDADSFHVVYSSQEFLYRASQTEDSARACTACTSPAKSVLRPRSGQEYVIIQRCLPHSAPDSQPPSLPSGSPCLSHVFAYDEVCPSQRLHRNCLLSLPHHLQHSLTSLSQSSCSASQTPQRSPSFTSAADTTRSFVSLLDPWEKDHSKTNAHPHGEESHDAAAPSATSSRSVSSHPVMSHSSISSAAHAGATRQKSSHVQPAEDSIFFPMDMSFTGSNPPSPFSPEPVRHSVSRQEHQAIYVNQEIVRQHQASFNRTISTSSSHSSASPKRTEVQSLRSVFHKDTGHSKRDLPFGVTSKSKSRTRSRHSESDARGVEKHSHSFSLPLNKTSKSLTLPSNVQRSHSDCRRSDRTIPRLEIAQHTNHSSCKVHQRHYDLFSDSKIIARRRLKCLESSDSGHQCKDANSSSSAVSNGSFLSLQIPSVRSSGYKNIDSFNQSATSSTSSHSFMSGGPDASHSSHFSHLENISESQYCPCALRPFSCDSDTVANVSKTKSDRCLSLSSDLSSAEHSFLPHSSPPPPIQRRRLPSSPLSSTPPSTPIVAVSDVSDSPPSYFAPPPPASPPELPPRRALLMSVAPPSPLPPSSPPSEQEIPSDSSEEEQELNYIEIDMTKPRVEKAMPKPVEFPRRSKRVKRQKDYAKLRYAEIDHRATKALEKAGQEHAQARDGSLRNPSTTLSRMNSAPASSKRKHLSFVQRERKLSSGSIESC